MLGLVWEETFAAFREGLAAVLSDLLGKLRERLCCLKLRDLLGPDGEVTNIAFQLELHVHQTGSWNMVATLPRWVGHISQEHKRDSQ